MTATHLRLPLDRFTLDEYIASGGMGSVWQASAAESRDRVAIKVLKAAVAHDPTSIEAFRSEVRAVARLRHAAIVSVFDYGEVSSIEAGASQEMLIAGSPYMVMELLRGPSLGKLRGLLSWTQLKGIASQVLSALAHSHARGIIHRDLKPSNVLLTDPFDTQSDSVPRIKVSDFGIAHALDATGDSWRRNDAKGTPGYMAPEQLENRWRDFGPWTDLYALGKMVLKLIGRGESAVRMAEQTPDAILDWLGRLVAADPRERFQRAADAAFGLESLDGTPMPMRRRAIADPDTLIDEARFITATTSVETVSSAALPPNRAQPPLPVSPTPPPAPPIERDWRLAGHPLKGSQPLGTGLGLYGMRPIPMVAREAERDQLWNCLVRVSERRRAESVVIRGASGVGKSRLARWLCQLGHESGAATVLRADHGTQPDASHGVSGMLRRLFRCEGMRREALLAHLEPRLRAIGLTDPSDWIAVTELLAPKTDGNNAKKRTPIRFNTQGERDDVVRRLLRHLAKERPVIVFLDDVQWGYASLALVRGAEMFIDTPVLFVVTVQEEALADAPLAAADLDSLTLSSTAHTLRLGQLESDAHKQLVRQLLGLADSLAVRVEALSDGNPLFAEQLVGDLVSRGQLVSQVDGRFRLRDGCTLEMPDDLHQLWAVRIEQLAPREDDAVALELAAVLGQRVDRAEWTKLCALAGCAPQANLVDRLEEQRLADSDHSTNSWEFAHSMLRESLERRARELGRHRQHHSCCAELLQKLGGDDVDERVGRHLLAADEALTAAPLLLAAAERRLRLGEYRDAHLLLALREQALDEAGLSMAAPERAAGWLRLAQCCRTEGSLDAAGEWTRRLIALCHELSTERMLCEALLVEQSVRRLRGDTDGALEVLIQAQQLATRIGDKLLLADCNKEQGWIRQNRGDLDGAAECFRTAIEIYENSDSDVAANLTSCLNGLAHGAVQSGRPDESREALERALELHRQSGTSSHQAFTLGALGDLERAQGNFAAAEQHYQMSLRLLVGSGYGHQAYPEMNLGLLRLDQCQFASAREFFEQAITSLEGHAHDPATGLPHAMLVPCLAAAHDWSAFDHHLAQARERLARGRLADADVAGPLRAAGDLAAEAGQYTRAAAALELSRQQWIELGRDDEVAAIEQLLGGLRHSRG